MENIYKLIEDKNWYAVMYTDDPEGDYDGFCISEVGFNLLKKHFLTTKKDVILTRYNMPIDDQEIIKFMIYNNLQYFEDETCPLSIKFFPIYEGIKTPYKIEMLDSLNICIYCDINYKIIAQDIVYNTNNNPLSKYIRERGFNNVMDVADNMK